MRLELSYRTEYSYAPAVTDALTALRLRPSTGPGLVVESADLRIEGGKLAVSYRDGWNTAVDLVECPGVHSDVAFEVNATVETVFEEREVEPTAFERFVYSRDSSRVRASAIDQLGWGVAGTGSSWTAVESVLRWLPQRFNYEVGRTNAQTQIEAVIRDGAGVCQDFSHIFLALLRSWGWCARYVSGYMFSGSAETPSIEAEAMHAWVEVHRPRMGWVALDPTAGDYADDRYVPVGRGRDYDDLAPVRGILRGNTTQKHTSRLEMMQQANQ